MKRRTFLQTTAAAAASAFGVAQRASAQSEHPNILWITCEDISAHLGCYGDTEATTPNLDALAAQGARYDNAYSICGVCAPSRSCLITGMYPPSIGTHHMRCNNPPEEHVRCFPEYLQEAGYYCTNNVKTDYNFPPPKSAWNDSSRNAHWRNRPDPDQPFFSVFNFTVTHESRIGTLRENMPEGQRAQLPDKRHDPANAQLPPYYPDTPVIREHWAHYYDLVTAMDAQAGEVLRQLEEDGLAENTIVFWFSDHGVGLPRAKRWLYDSGLHVPMIVRWPGVIEPGSTRDELVSFVDFAPTVLSLAGVNPPDHMQGQPFLGGNAAPPREFVYGMRDRMDERYDHIRAVRDKRYKYIRNYEPYRAYDQYLKYPENFPVMQDMRRVQAAGELTAAQALFFRQEKPIEELYDTDADPHELNNLAAQPDQSGRLERMRAALNDWELAIGDLGAIPEFALGEWLGNETNARATSSGPDEPDAGTTKHFGRSAAQWNRELTSTDRRRRVAAAKAVGCDFGAGVSRTELSKLLHDPDPLVAYWGAISLAHTTAAPSQEDTDRLAEMLDSDRPAHALGAAKFHIENGQIDETLPALESLMAHDNPFARLHAVQLLELIAESRTAARALLEDALDDETNYVRHTAERALTKYRETHPAS